MRSLATAPAQNAFTIHHTAANKQTTYTILTTHADTDVKQSDTDNAMENHDAPAPTEMVPFQRLELHSQILYHRWMMALWTQTLSNNSRHHQTPPMTRTHQLPQKRSLSPLACPTQPPVQKLQPSAKEEIMEIQETRGRITGHPTFPNF